MTIRSRGSSFMVDVKVGASVNPTGQALRVRAAFPTYEIARRMEGLIRADLTTCGRWERNATDHCVTGASDRSSAPDLRQSHRPRESEDQLKQRRARILRAMGEYPRLVWTAPS